MENDIIENKVIVFASDTQAPMLVETILLRPHKNRLATRLLFKEILALEPRAFFHLGDVVNLGYSDRQWRPIDEYLKELKENNIDVQAIMGNHEVMGQPRKGERKFQLRFPDHVRTGYSKKVGSLAIVLLNSNFSTLTPTEDKKQLDWFENKMQEFDLDPSVDFIITCCHHSPFTNSRIVKPSREVEKKFVPIYISSRKSQLFLSGHCHAFEHFKVRGKDFMVIGGGGGLKQPLRQGVGALTDLAAEYKPMFHYLTIKVEGNVLDVRCIHLRKDFEGFDEGWKVVIKHSDGYATVGN